MAEQPFKYHRLPGGRRISFGYESLYLGPDHLLAVRGRGWIEEYKRFYFRDIQALITRKTAVGAVQNLAAMILGVLFLIPIITSKDPEAWWWGVPAAVCLLILIGNWWRGPTCLCHIQTAVQIEKLPSLHILKKANRAIAILRQHIEAAQGQLTPEIVSSLTGANTLAVPMTSVIARPILRPESGTSHLILFLLLLVDATLSLLHLLETRSLALTLASVLTILSLAVAVVVALVKQSGSNLGTFLRRVTWAVAGYLSLMVIYGYFLFVYAAIHNPGAANHQLRLLQAVTELTSDDIPYLFELRLTVILVAVTLAVGGLVLLGLNRRLRSTDDNHQPPPVKTPTT